MSNTNNPLSLIGQTLGQYEISGLLGRGGMATVYRAKQQSMKRDVALKVISPSLAGDDLFVERFNREVQIVASLSHPHILKVFDYGNFDGILFLAMEMLTGGNLADAIKNGPLTITTITTMLEQISLALDYAHRRGIVHRDLKPQNVLLDEDHNVFLTDFGLAKPLNSNTGGLTQSGTVLGTPAYMSPEQWRSSVIDGRADIYALGIMVFEMLTGKLPFTADTPYTAMHAHIYETPPFISDIQSDISTAMDDVILKALAKEPQDRYASAGELVTAFKAASQDAGTTPIISAEKATVLRDAASQRETAQAALDATHQIVTVTKPSPTVPTPPPAEVTVAAKANRLQPRFLVAGVGIILAILVIGLIVFSQNRTPSVGSGSATQAPDSAISLVTPVAADEYMALIAQIEPVGSKQREVTRFIINELQQTLEQGIAFSKIRIREYPNVIRTSAEAAAVAKANNATIIVWGTDDGNVTDLQLQVGALNTFTYNKFSAENIDRTLNVNVQLTDPRTQSIAPQIAMMLVGLETADGNVFELSRYITVFNQLTVPRADVVGTGVAAQVFRSQPLLLSDPATYVTEMSKAIDLDSLNALLYSFRALGYQRLDKTDLALQDYNTAEKQGYKGWVIPLFGLALNDLEANQLPSAIARFDTILKDRPDDWFDFTMRGSLHYFNHDYDLAAADYAQSEKLSPTANFADLLSALLSLHQGRITEARTLIASSLKKYPDLQFGERLMHAMLGPSTFANRLSFGAVFSADTYLLLGQYERVTSTTQTALDGGALYARPELYLVQGFAACNLDKYADAETAYTQGVAADPTFTLLYAMRAEVRLKQGNALGAAADYLTARNAKLGTDFDALLDSAAKGNVSCKNFFSTTN